ncbi:MAG: CPBP family intramembrane glutamic endopeptidase [Terracidiphilus sp.]
MTIHQAAIVQESHSRHRMESIAPAWHTAGVLLLLAALIVSSMRLHGADHAYHRITGYLVVLSAEWLITAFIWFGCRMQGISMRSLAGDMASSWRAVLRDLGLAFAFLIAANTVLAVVGYLIHSTPGRSVQNLLPHGGTEVAVYLLMALTAGICEEVIYRGYLQRQFTAWTTSAAAGIVLQSAVFGSCHAYQGFGMVLTISIYGCFFGVLARWRGSLRPGIIAHCLQDGVGGLLLARAAMK